MSLHGMTSAKAHTPRGGLNSTANHRHPARDKGSRSSPLDELLAVRDINPHPHQLKVVETKCDAI
jgi:hypothetical protein